MNTRTLLLPGLSFFLAVHVLEARTWTEAGTGRKIEAEFVSADDTTVTVAVQGAKTVAIELSRLSAEDQAFVLQQRQLPRRTGESKPATKAEDGFEEVKILSVDQIPVSGEGHKALAAVDDAIRQFMVEKGVPALSFALSKGGKVLHDRAFGWGDAARKTPLEPGVKMRLASMTKPVVKAAILTLFADRKLKPDDLVFSLLDLGQHKEAKDCDPRWKQVTVQHLLDHKGGWDRDTSGDFTNDSSKMCGMFRLKADELEPVHVVRYGLTRPMDFDPGTKDVYCNYGYILLVRVIEKVSGVKFTDYLQSTVCRSAGAPSFSLSSSDARNRQAGEVWYCYHPEYPEKQVPLGFRTEARDGAGVLACTAADYCRFLETYWISGAERRPGASYSYAFNGSHPGVTAVCSQRPDGISYAAIANRRGGGRTDWNGDLRKAIDAALASVADKLR